MGHEIAHPDEPEPWVYSVEADEVTVPPRPPAVGTVPETPNGRSPGSGSRHASGYGGRASADHGVAPTREARPMPAPGLADDPAEEEASDTESLLRELHSLAALDEVLADPGRQVGNGRGAPPSSTSAAAPPPPPKDATPMRPQQATPPASPRDATPPAAPEAATPRPTRGDPSAIADAFAELSALDVPARSIGRSTGSTPGPSATPTSQDSQQPSATPPLPNGHRDHADTPTPPAEGGLSALFSEGPLFGEGDEPDPGAGRGPAGTLESGGAGSDVAPEREYEATLHVVPTPGRNGLAGRANGQHPAGGTPPPPVADLGPGLVEGDVAATNGHRVPAPDLGSGPDLSSFTAKGGPGSRRARRRRLAR